jgi:adenosyl cobinamide kinase/adenosyl cobinamide phosphate guanylyltransferase
MTILEKEWEGRIIECRNKAKRKFRDIIGVLKQKVKLGMIMEEY